MTPARTEMLERAKACLAGKSRSYVDDARAFAAVIVSLLRENEQLTQNVTDVQTRCTELLLEARARKGTTP